MLFIKNLSTSEPQFSDNLNIIQEIIKKKKNKKLRSPLQQLQPISNKRKKLSEMKAKKLNYKKKPTEKGFFGRKTETLVKFYLLNCDTTMGFGSCDIDKKFLKKYIDSNFLIEGHLQIKVSLSNIFGVADLFYFLVSPPLNLLLLNYEINTKNRSFKITKAFLVKLNSSFFEFIISKNLDFFKFLSQTKNPYSNFNNKKNREAEKISFFSYSFKRTRWQGALKLKQLIEFLEQDKKYGSIDEIKVKNNHFTFCGVDIPSSEFY